MFLGLGAAHVIVLGGGLTFWLLPRCQLLLFVLGGGQQSLHSRQHRGLPFVQGNYLVEFVASLMHQLPFVREQGQVLLLECLDHAQTELVLPSVIEGGVIVDVSLQGKVSPDFVIVG